MVFTYSTYALYAFFVNKLDDYRLWKRFRKHLNAFWKLFGCWVKSYIPRMTQFYTIHRRITHQRHQRSLSANHLLSRHALRVRPFYRMSNGRSTIGDRRNRNSPYINLPCQAFQAAKRKTAPSGFDTDSFTVLVDNCATRSITTDASDFIDSPVKVKGKLKGVSGSMPVLCKGTVRWYIEDDQGTVHKLLLPNTLYVPNAPERLLSPQHWAQARRKQGDVANGTLAITYSDRVELQWDRQRHCRTIVLDPNTNVASLTSAPGYTKFRVYRSQFDQANYSMPEQEFFGALPRPPSDSEGDTVAYSSISDASDQLVPESNLELVETPTKHEIKRVDEDLEVTHNNPQAELLRWHCRLGHLSFKTIRSMAANGILPKRLVDCQVPKCSSCVYGKLHRKPYTHEEHLGT